MIQIPMKKVENSGASMGFTLRCGNSTNNAGCQTVQMLVRAGGRGKRRQLC